MDVTLGSIFRNSVSYLPRFFDQIAGFEKIMETMGHQVSYCFAEGDSTDNTYEELEGYQFNHRGRGVMRIVKAEHGGPVFGSIDNAQRWRQKKQRKIVVNQRKPTNETETENI